MNAPSTLDAEHKLRACPQCGGHGKCLRLADGAGGICFADGGRPHCWGKCLEIHTLLAEFFQKYGTDAASRHHHRQ